MALSEERFWDLSSDEYVALRDVRTESQKESILGFQFLATVFAQSFTGDPDISFMPEAERALIPLDKMEGYFKAMAEAAKARNGE